MRAIEVINAELEQVHDQRARRKKLLTAWEDLKNQRRERQRALEEAEVSLSKEHADVEELERLSLKSLLAALKGDKEERLSKERREELSAQLRRDQALRDLEEIQSRVLAMEEELRTLPPVDAKLASLLEEKASVLRAQGGAAGERLTALEEELTQVKARQKELAEAISAGNRVLSAVGRMEVNLEDARRMGAWDMLGGGLFATAAKHDHLDSARYAADEVQRALRSFRTELADVSMEISAPTVEMDGFTRFADYFFDGLFADWAVQNRIGDAQSGAWETRSKVNQVLQRLSGMEWETRSQAAALEKEREDILSRTYSQTT